ncbi:MAG: alkaline phosphatase [Alistipes sp.]|nr:alkaline phosphatase [Alistipes sp.]
MRRKLISLLALLLLPAMLWAQEPIRNIIFLIGDGMGLSSVTMMQLAEGTPTIFDKAENIALTRTASADNRVTDSAAAGTALATGCKTNNTYLGMAPDGEELCSLTALASEQGKATGVVVTTYLQHATPAAFYAHSDSRHNMPLITRQLTASHLDVAIGGGMHYFIEVYGDSVAEELKAEHKQLATTLEEVAAMGGDDRVVALLADYEVGSDSGDYLRNATREALRLLERQGGEEGFVLMVEGSLIDGMGHGNNAEAMQKEMRSFMSAVEYAVEYATNNDGTLVVVTADHETGGLGLVSGNADFNLSEQGVEYRWCTTGHSAQMVPVYLYGTGAELINGIMENSELGTKLKSLIE